MDCCNVDALLIILVSSGRIEKNRVLFPWKLSYMIQKGYLFYFV